mmetsp:Transcript_34187/g.55791  ORF Transcript_34187/g.55791 Transcript_34187/m.55791 type:complete len:211 (+) Transcript_34187:130-762(+)
MAVCVMYPSIRFWRTSNGSLSSSLSSSALVLFCANSMTFCTAAPGLLLPFLLKHSRIFCTFRRTISLRRLLSTAIEDLFFSISAFFSSILSCLTKDSTRRCSRRASRRSASPRRRSSLLAASWASTVPFIESICFWNLAFEPRDSCSSSFMYFILLSAPSRPLASAASSPRSCPSSRKCPSTRASASFFCPVTFACCARSAPSSRCVSSP